MKFSYLRMGNSRMASGRLSVWLLSAALLLAILLPLVAVGCRPSQPPQTIASSERTFAILSINDVYRIEGVDGGTDGGLARVRTLRQRVEEEHPDLLFLHAGDLLFPSLLSRQLFGEQMIDVLNRLDGSPGELDDHFFAVFGNHEFEKGKVKDAAILDARVDTSEFVWLDTNIRWKQGDDGQALVSSERMAPLAVVESGGVSVGLFGLSTDLDHPDYVEDFGDLEAIARRSVEELRSRGAEVVVALTHLPITEDLEVLRKLGSAGPDLVVGGHEHNRLCRALDASGQTIDCDAGDLPLRPVVKADAEARTAALIRVKLRDNTPPEISLEYQTLGPDVPEDPEIRGVVGDWLKRHEAQYCFDNLDQPPGCLEKVFGRTNVRLQGEELIIRRFESNLGNFIVDQALAGYREEGVVAAFINSGTLRLNQDIPADSDITLRHVEEIFQFPSDLKVMKITGAVLQSVIETSITDWTGNGRYLQIAGFAYHHDPEKKIADRLTLLTPKGPRPVEPEEELLVVTSDYLATPSTGQDGYTMLTEDMLVQGLESLTLKDLMITALQVAGNQGISPAVEGRICTDGYPGPCLAVAN